MHKKISLFEMPNIIFALVRYIFMPEFTLYFTIILSNPRIQL